MGNKLEVSEIAIRFFNVNSIHNPSVKPVLINTTYLYMKRNEVPCMPYIFCKKVQRVAFFIYFYKIVNPSTLNISDTCICTIGLQNNKVLSLKLTVKTEELSVPFWQLPARYPFSPFQIRNFSFRKPG